MYFQDRIRHTSSPTIQWSACSQHRTNVCSLVIYIIRISVSYVPVAYSVQFRKKKDKMATIKYQKDETIQKGDVYKSHTVSVGSGLPPTSVSAPVPKKKPGVVRPITSGKLLRKGGPSDNVRRPTRALSMDCCISDKLSNLTETQAASKTNASSSPTSGCIDFPSTWSGCDSRSAATTTTTANFYPPRGCTCCPTRPQTRSTSCPYS